MQHKIKVTLKNGRTAVIREANEDDAPAFLAYIQLTAAESDFMVSLPDEVANLSVPYAAAVIRMNDDPISTMLMAFVDGKLAGTCSYAAKSQWRKIRHRAELGISVAKAYWGLGLASALIDQALAFATAFGITQMELGVFSGNTRALALYERKGFEHIGLIPRAAILDDGTAFDEHRMLKMLADARDA